MLPYTVTVIKTKIGCKRYFNLVLIRLPKAGPCWDASYEKQYSIIATLKI